MRWQVRGLNVRLSEAIRSYAERKLGAPLRGTQRHVQAIVLRLKDLDPSNMASPRLASATVTLRGGEVFEVRQEDPSLYAAIDQLSDRLSRAIRRRVGRRITRSRH